MINNKGDISMPVVVSEPKNLNDVSFKQRAIDLIAKEQEELEELKRQKIINKIEFIRNKTIQLNETPEVLYPNTSEEIAKMRKNPDTVLELNRLGISFEQLENQHEIYVEDSVTFQELIEKEFGDDWIDALNLYLDYKMERK